MPDASLREIESLLQETPDLPVLSDGLRERILAEAAAVQSDELYQAGRQQTASACTLCLLLAATLSMQSLSVSKAVAHFTQQAQQKAVPVEFRVLAGELPGEHPAVAVSSAEIGGWEHVEAMNHLRAAQQRMLRGFCKSSTLQAAFIHATAG